MFYRRGTTHKTKYIFIDKKGISFQGSVFAYHYKKQLVVHHLKTYHPHSKRNKSIGETKNGINYSQMNKHIKFE